MTISKSGNTFTFASTASGGGGGSPAGATGYLQYYSADGFSADDGLQYDVATESFRVGSGARHFVAYTVSPDVYLTANGNSNLRIVQSAGNPITVGDWEGNGNYTYLQVDDQNAVIDLNATTINLNGAVVGNLVNTINGKTGAVSLSGGTAISVSASGNTLSISATIEDIISIYVDSTPDVVPTGTMGFRMIPYNCIATEWYVIGGNTGSVQFDIRRSSFADYPSTSSVVGGDYPVLSSQIKNSNTGITAWSGFSSGDVVDFVINSVSDLEKVGLYIKIRRIS
jgi:hypothetical protein